MNEKKIEPTDAMVECIELGHKLMHMDDRTILRLALNHPDAAELLAAEWKANAEAAAERAERAEEMLAEAVHVDEAARRVEAAREQGWDDAADWVKQREAWTDEELRAANPHRPVPDLPTKPGTVLDPFAGSGTTLEAAVLEGFNAVGIEREADYLPLIHARLERATTTLAAQAEADADTLFPIDGAAS